MRVSEFSMFKNQDYAETLVKEGVVKIPFLSNEQLQKLNEFYFEMHPDDDLPALYDGIHMTIWHSDLEYKFKIRDNIKLIIAKAFEDNFLNYRALSHQFIVKKQGSVTTFPIHQDWSIVDENKFFSLNIWIPLHDVDASNGAMWIVKGSHKIDRKIRGAGILFPDYTKMFSELKPFMTSYDMKAGEALIFYHSTIHGSPCNQSENSRKVVQVSLLPKEAIKQIFFQKDEFSLLEIHYPKDDFSFEYNSIREESLSIPPTKHSFTTMESQKMNRIPFEEISKYLK
ncbi:MAG: hypothetical protein EBQ94_13710 [Flavobacteriales bacterium]|nr:hypothetical protein [Flavobacteriales bacterium]NCA21447.1 hypothetical protein [Crocinitomicaceae bacterium]